MSYFTDDEIRALSDRLSGMAHAVRLVFFTQAFGCESCATARRILDDLPRANALVSVEEKNLVLDAAEAETLGITVAPGVAIIGDRDRGLRFYGAPDGYEMVSLLEGIALASGADSQLTDESRALVATLDGPRALQIFSTPT